MNDFRLSFYCFFALAILLPWALGVVLYRQIHGRKKDIATTIASMAALAFVIGAVWWTAIHPAIWQNPNPAQPNPNPPPIWGLAVLAGVAGMIAQSVGTVVLLAILALWDRAQPGTFARLSAHLQPRPQIPPTTDS